MNFTEDQLSKWSASPSQTETDRMYNAENAVKKAIAECETLKMRSIRVFAQGSYRNRVNVRADSDVDVAVVCTDVIFFEGVTGEEVDSFGYTDNAYSFTQFRSDVGKALKDYFASGVVTPGDKAFDVKANSYRVEADVAPFFVHRRFTKSGSYTEGVEMRSVSGKSIINWPDQHYANGVEKNRITARSYKGCTRIMKALRYKMLADGYESAKGSPSFLMECLMWNVPDVELGSSTWTADLRASLVYLYNATKADADCSEWGEVSELKYLFRTSQPWTRAGANQFIYDCWNYVGF
jgi:hypothetical protein